MTKLRKPKASKQVNGQNTSSALKPTNLTTQMQEAVRQATKVNMPADFQKLLIGNTLAPKSIQFGSPSGTSSKSRASSAAGNEWTNLLDNATSGTIDNLIGGGFLQSGIDSLVSGIANLFDGGGKSESPLVRFVLPDSQQQTMYMSSEGFYSSVGNIASPQSNSKGELYNNAQSQGTLYRQSEIVQAVKNALLTSSSLNDIIAEI